MSIRKKEYYRLLTYLCLGLIVLLSGCTLFPQFPSEGPISFDSTSAIFYNPYTNASNSFSVKNLNRSSSTFLHGNQMEILVGLKDNKSVPGIAYNLTLGIKYEWGYYTSYDNLTEDLGIILTTNESGIAYLRYTYNQYSWPKNSLSTEGSLEVTSTQLNNTRVTSGLVSFHFYTKQIIRNTTTTGGLEVIDFLEGSNLIEDAIALGGNDNLYPDWNDAYFEVKRAIINLSTVQYYTGVSGYPRLSISYVVWAIFFEDTNLTYPFIEHNWNTYIPLGLFGGISDDILKFQWLMTGYLSQVNLTTGWLIVQRIYVSAYRQALNAWGATLEQTSLVSSDLHLEWLISKSSQWIS